MDNSTYFEPNFDSIKKEKVLKATMTKKDFVFMPLMLFCSFLFVSFGVWFGFNLGFTITYVALFAVTTAYLFKKANAFSIICGLLSLAGCVTFSLFDDFFINMIMLLLVAGLYVIYAVGISNTFNHKQGSFRVLFDAVLSTFVYPFTAFDDIIESIKVVAKSKKKSFAGLFGFLLAIPAVAIIIPLLVKSDAAFEGLVSSTFKNIGIVLLQLIIALVITPLLFSFCFEKRKALNVNPNIKSKKIANVPSSACVSFLSVISVVYVVYLFSQLAYFFSAFKGILPEGYKYTASEFARRGFFEMFAICAINLAIISVASIVAKRKTIAFKLLSVFVSAFSVLLIVIAMQKMKLNISIYGLSKNRVMVSVFMVMMLVVIAFFVLHIFAPKISYMQPIIIVCSAIFIALSFSNVDARIAEYNINAYENGAIESLDVDAIANLSSSSIPYVVDLMNNDNEEISKRATLITAQLYNDYFGKDSDRSTDFRAFNLAKSKAVLCVDTVPPMTDLYKNVIELYGKQNCNYFDEEDVFENYYEEDNLYCCERYDFDKDKGIYVLNEEESYKG